MSNGSAPEVDIPVLLGAPSLHGDVRIRVAALSLREPADEVGLNIAELQAPRIQVPTLAWPKMKRRRSARPGRLYSRPMSTREVRFGLTKDGRYSNHWTVIPKAGRPEFQIVNSAVNGRAFHISIHDPSYGFHVKVVDGSGMALVKHEYPNEILPGARRFVEVRMPQATVCRDAPAKAARIAWFVPPPEPETWVTFQIVVHDAEIDDPYWWRGHLSGQGLVGEALLSDGRNLVIVAGVMPGFDGEWSGHSNSPNAEELKRLARQGDAGAIFTGINLDNSLWLLDLPSANRVASGST